MHTHSWKFNEWYIEDGGLPVHCRTCPASLEWKDILRRLNAAEMLSAEDARMAADSIGEGWAESPDRLRAYASALEGET